MAITVPDQLRELGFSKYEIACYLSLVAKHPANGSQVSKASGVARSKVYDVLRSMAFRGLVGEVGNGMYIPLPPEELIKRLKQQFKANVALLRSQISRSSKSRDHEHLWIIRGYEQALNKIKSMISAATDEIYIRLFPAEENMVRAELVAAEARGVKIRYICLGESQCEFKVQVIHPDHESLAQKLGGRSMDIVVDKTETLTGLIDDRPDEELLINWTQNRWFTIANRDSMRHDFYHCYFHKLYDEGVPLSGHEEQIYRLIKSDD